jgi:hypothetical protein
MEGKQDIGRAQAGAGPYFLGEEIGAQQDLRVARQELPPGQPAALRRWGRPLRRRISAMQPFER